MEQARAQRRLGAAGLLFVALLIIAVVTSSNLDSNSTAADVVASIHKHKSGLQFSAFITGLAVFEGLGFLWYLREYLCEVASNRRLASLAYVGVIFFATSGALDAGFKFAMADAVDRVDPNAMQTLNILQNDLHVVLGGVGVAMFLIATGVAVIRNGPLPTWLGWVGVMFGVLGVVGGAPAAGLWILLASITILVRANQGTPATTP
jgi:uncharacterized protein DUF4386